MLTGTDAPFETTAKVYDVGVAKFLLSDMRLRPPYQQNDYIDWITRGKREETRQKRLEQMIEELRFGNAYMGMKYNAKLPE